ncbi:MAG TPA: glutathione peroxidase [Anaerolineaceae bacterium]|nr:glutathione peroxidase [Anaerolineaceae bacterium]
MTTIYDFTVEDAQGKSVALSQYKNNVMIIVNTASKCGFTPQYKELQSLYEAWHDKGLEILAFPCNQFAGQESGTNEEIQEFCQMNFGLTFPVLSKINVNGKDSHPLYKYLRSQKGTRLGSQIKWNFTKFLIAKDGSIFKRFEPNTNPEEMAPFVEALLKEKDVS